MRSVRTRELSARFPELIERLNMTGNTFAAVFLDSPAAHAENGGRPPRIRTQFLPSSFEPKSCPCKFRSRCRPDRVNLSSSYLAVRFPAVSEESPHQGFPRSSSISRAINPRRPRPSNEVLQTRPELPNTVGFRGCVTTGNRNLKEHRWRYRSNAARSRQTGKAPSGFAETAYRFGRCSAIFEHTGRTPILLGVDRARCHGSVQSRSPRHLGR